MHRRRSRSPRFRSPIRSRIDRSPVRDRKSYSISSSDYIEKSRDKGSKRNDKYQDDNLQLNFERSDRERHDSYTKYDHSTYHGSYSGNERHSATELMPDPSICNFTNSQMSSEEPSFLQPNNSNDRLGRLEKMVELLVQNSAKSLETQPVEPLYKSNFITSVWLNKISEECLERHFDEISCINFMQNNMSGLMKAWFKTLNPYDYTWPELKMLITHTFPDAVDFAATLRLLVERRKRPDETITQYYFSKMYLIEACKISGPNAVSCLIDGLNDPIIQKEAKEQNFLTPENLYAQFLSKIPNYGLEGHIIEPNKLEVTRDHMVRDKEEHVYDRNDSRRKIKDDEVDKKCGCHKRGHSENCRHAPICYKCRRKGHIAAKCPK